MIKRYTHLLNEFSRKKSEAKLIQQLRKSVKAVDANAHGTSGYTIKQGKTLEKFLSILEKFWHNLTFFRGANALLKINFSLNINERKLT